jgi:hypothetical protein
MTSVQTPLPTTAQTSGQAARTWVGPSARDRLEILRRTRTVAIVGASANPSRSSYFVATYLLASTPYEVWFVNPRADRILGREVYPSLADLPTPPDIVDVFRRLQRAPQVLDEAVDAWREDPSGCSSVCGTRTSPRAVRPPG